MEAAEVCGSRFTDDLSFRVNDNLMIIYFNNLTTMDEKFCVIQALKEWAANT